MPSGQFGKQTRRGLLVVGAVSMASSLPFIPLADAASTIQNLRLTAGAISWINHDDIQIPCQFRWVGSNKSWVLKPSEPVHAVFRDSQGSYITGAAGIVTQTVSFQSGFLDGSVKTVTATVRATVPSQAASVSIALGASKLETAPAKLPRRP
jgi:hypothetical protein